MNCSDKVTLARTRFDCQAQSMPLQLWLELERPHHPAVDHGLFPRYGEGYPVARTAPATLRMA